MMANRANRARRRLRARLMWMHPFHGQRFASISASLPVSPAPFLTDTSDFVRVGRFPPGIGAGGDESAEVRRLLVGLLVLGLAVPAGLAVAAPARPAPTASDYLSKLVRLSSAPEYRRFGSAAMGQVAGFAAGALAKDGYQVVSDDIGGLSRWAVDYAEADRPQLVRVADGHQFKTESAFEITPTGPDGVECTVKKVADVGPGDCGLVPFSEGSPEWKNVSYNAPADVATIVGKGGIGAVVQGDVQRNLVYALRLHSPGIPVVVSVVRDDIVGQRVRLRAMGASVPAVAHNIVGVLPPPAGSSLQLKSARQLKSAQYVMLLAHM